MPEIGRIQSTNFQSLLTDLGITRNNIPFALRSEVTPVVLVGGTVSFIAAPTPAYRVVDAFTAGEQVAPAALTVLADTGPLPLGTYSAQVFYGAQESNKYDFQWRNFDNTVTLVNIRLQGAALVLNQFLSRFNIENDNERLRILNVDVGTVGIAYNASILARI